jgi:hypothetical protein
VIHQARAELGYRPAESANLGVLLFGAGPVSVEPWARTETQVRQTVDALQAIEPSPRDRALHQHPELGELDAIADAQPVEVVSGAFGLVERELRQIADAGSAAYAADMPAAVMADELARAGLIHPQSVAAVRGLGVLHNLAVQGLDQMSAEKARDYLALTDAVLEVLNRQPPRDAEPPPNPAA